MAREATATVIRSTKESARFALRDLSSGGARLVGELPLFEGEHIWLRIELQDPIEIAADVVHFDHQRKVAEVAFRGVSADALTKIERAIADMIARVPESSPATVLVVHPVLDVSSALERDLAKIGVAARVSATLADITAQLADHAV